MSKKTDVLKFVNKTIEGINKYEKITGKRPPAYIYLDNLVEIQQALLKGQELKDENRILLEEVSDLEDQNVLYAKDLYNCEEILNIIKEKGVNVGYLRTCKTLDDYNSDFWNDEEDFNKKLTQEEFDLLKRYTNGKQIN